MPPKITINSPEYVCFHEAGHATTALFVGATVHEMELYRDPQRNYGRIRAERTRDQARHIALGGFAAEYLLYASCRLVKQDGGVPTEKEFIDYAFSNAADDYSAFWLAEAGSTDPATLGLTQREMDEKFMNYAVGRAKNEMNFMLVERLADALFTAGKLAEQDVLDTVSA